jgi:hypothetical protein
MQELNQKDIMQFLSETAKRLPVPMARRVCDTHQERAHISFMSPHNQEKSDQDAQSEAVLSAN